MTGTLHLGTSSFSAEGWVGPFYPAGTRPADMLGYYASKYSTVEIDSTYYRAPSPSMCRRWEAVTPRDFAFSLKVPKAITHDKALVDIDAEWKSFLDAVKLLGTKLRFLVLQFPYWNQKSAIPDLKTFLERLERFPADAPCPVVVETRNPKWIGPELLALLRARRLIFALQDQGWMPRPGVLWKRFGRELQTGPSVYIRMLGEREQIEKLTQTWDKIVIDRTEQVNEWLPLVQDFLAQELEVSMYFNNHFEGHAPESIEKLKRLWNTGLTA